MHPTDISVKEDKFADTLVLTSGQKFKSTGKTAICDGFEIESIRPSAETYYYPTSTKKKSICLHFTVGYIMSDIATLAKAGNHVSVSYVVDRAGRIYELFPDNYWSYHLGKGTIGGNEAMSKQSIGIEISNYGPLSLKNSKLMDAYGNTYCSENETDLYEKHAYRGNEYYATMSDPQIGATAALVKYLSAKHNIPLVFMDSDLPFASAAESTAFTGIFYHSNVRKDKFDWPLSYSMTKVRLACEEPRPVDQSSPSEPVGQSAAQPTAPVPESKSDHKPAAGAVCPDPARTTPVKPSTPKTATRQSSGEPSFLYMLKEIVLYIIDILKKH